MKSNHRLISNICIQVTGDGSCEANSKDSIDCQGKPKTLHLCTWQFCLPKIYKPGKIYLSTIINIIGKHLNDKSNSNTCCRANTAKCRSCAAGIDIEEYCENNPTIIGCEGLKFNKICYH